MGLCSAIDLSLLASAGLAAAWVLRERQQQQRGSAASATDAGASFATAFAASPGWALVMLVKDLNQVLPTVFLVLAAASYYELFASVTSLGLWEAAEDGGGWLGSEDISWGRHVALVSSLTVWRAEKLESLIQRMQRSAGAIRADGAGGALMQGFKDPFGYLWPALWGSGRRAAQIPISTFGSVLFVQTAFPAVAFDEFLWWATAKLQGLFDRHVRALPAVVDIIVLPLVDLLHLVPVIVKVFLLGILEYPGRGDSMGHSVLLSVCALAWTAHNCHIFYTTGFVDVPESARQLWAARGAGAAG
eukprot:TRINITY_DN71216_c0_g1_i1.p1 TRINITY_DN71216_c0_g1~~TRINITY_DN71216_c0_g1_i1.p1  ORF type:complete len:329 (-),score=58.16 TRINITY_DN71216_c0_g1_i1:8-916(-)